MREFILNHFKLEHLLCVLILISRLGDIITTFLVSPKLKLETNPIVRKLGWWFAVPTILVCFAPYFSTELGVVVLVPSLLVCASNASKIWFVRAYGESEYYDLLLRLARKSKLSHALAATILSTSFIALAGLVLLFLCPNPDFNWGFWFAIGFLAYAFVVAFYGCLFFIRLFRSARRKKEDSLCSTPTEAALVDDKN